MSKLIVQLSDQNILDSIEDETRLVVGVYHTFYLTVINYTFLLGAAIINLTNATIFP